MSTKVRFLKLMGWLEHEEQVKQFKEILERFHAIGIIHDKDIKEDGQDAKPHFHCVVHFENPRTLQGFIKEYPSFEGGCGNEPYVSYLDYPKKAIEYLTHENAPNKHHYGIDELILNDESYKDDFLADKVDKEKAESDNVKEIFEFIISNGRQATIQSVLQFCLEKGYYSTYRRGASVFNNLIKEVR